MDLAGLSRLARHLGSAALRSLIGHGFATMVSNDHELHKLSTYSPSQGLILTCHSSVVA
jgi:hypothetical protein